VMGGPREETVMGGPREETVMGFLGVAG